ncbi:BppU family phage baseplate upper protein [Staphylococcus haemolyticus]|uniref:SGNH hydrolase-type esterase domain-containing protein n=1 Tax=Staphylococcus haemolyticus (strain JCSC1435) TaxID=279808 RepID=Q4L3Y3_STAHJ|nr:BppU family phage baseplate upper protein [Staphylococcus haemolyticus]BAE05644.1 unnamed protein product [Staphylococcus haemolyticus JCSC1435]
MLQKMTDVETHINPRSVDIGDIGSRFYTEDENTAFIRIRINYNGSPVDLTKTDMKPKLDLFMEDGSIFIDEPTEYLLPESGLIQYNIPTKVIKHAGRVSCKLFMENSNKTIHVANFTFQIIDSGIENAVTKVVDESILQSLIKEIMQEQGYHTPENPTDHNDNTPINTSSTSQLNGLTGVFIGDSITEKNFRTTTNYHQFIANRTGLKNVNMGISGTGYQDRKNVAYDIKEQPDFISVFLGTNDWGLVGDKIRPLGDPDNISPSTVASAIYYTYKQLTEQFPTTPIVVLTPLPRLECNPMNEQQNKADYTLGDLVNVIKKVASKFSLPVLDLYHDSNLKVWIDYVNKTYFSYEPGKEDGLHPNAKGHEFISHQIQSFYENFAVVSPKVEYKKPKRNDETLDNGAIVSYITPKSIYWKPKQSLILNFDKSTLDLTGRKIIKVESDNGSLINQMGMTANSPFWYTIPDYPDGSQYNRTKEVIEFTNTLETMDYTSSRGYEYLPTVLKVTHVDANSKVVGSYSDTDGMSTATNSESPKVDVDSPLYRTPKSDKPDEDLGNGLFATYLYPKRMFWIKGQSFAINIDPFDMNVEEIYISSIETATSKIGKPSSVSVNTPAYYQLNNYADGNDYNRLTEITNFLKDVPIETSTSSRIDYKQIELKIIYSKTPIKTTATNNTTTVTPVIPIANSDGTYTATLTPTGIYWKNDQSFTVNVDSKALDLTNKTVTKIEYQNKTLNNASAIFSNSPTWYTVPKYNDGEMYNKTSSVQDFVNVLTQERVDTNGRVKYKNVEIKITYK